MLHTLWSVKGGSGVSVTSASLALGLARQARRTVLVDLAGDQPAVLGLPEPTGPGVSDWLASTDGSVDALGRLLLDVGQGLWLLPRGHAGAWSAERSSTLVAALSALRCEVVVDAGVRVDASPSATAWESLGISLAGAGRSLLVSRPCYVALRRYQAARETARAAARGAAAPPWLPDGVVVLVDQDRALRPQDVAATLHLPLIATIGLDPGVARAVDAGTLMHRPRRALTHQLRRVA